jgi:non-canonical (house-cleaning) NTP pyrophosphatase
MNTYQKKYGTSKIISSEIFKKQLNKDLENNNNEITGNVNVFVTSNKKLKIEATKLIFSKNKRLANSNLFFHGYSCPSDIAEQPLSVINGEKGATNRLKNIKIPEEFQNSKTPYFICSIENFFTEPEIEIPTDHAFVVIQNEKGEVYRYISDGVEICREIYDETLKKGVVETGSLFTIGDTLSKEFEDLDSSNWHKDVTKTEKYSGITREEQILTSFSERNNENYIKYF